MVIIVYVYVCGVFTSRTPHPVIVTIRDNKDYIRVLFYSYYTTITGWGALLTYSYYSCFKIYSDRSFRAKEANVVLVCVGRREFRRGLRPE